jgi:hypothetical protein
LADVIDQETPPDRIVKALADALAADLVNRDGTRGPDHRTRVQAASLLLAYRIGRPIERSEVVSVNLDADSSVGLRERLASSPAMKAALLKLLNDSGPAVEA